MTRDERYMMESLAMILDASLPALEAAAAREKVREKNKSMRQITEQLRVESARELVGKAWKMLAPQDDDE